VAQQCSEVRTVGIMCDRQVINATGKISDIK